MLLATSRIWSSLILAAMLVTAQSAFAQKKDTPGDMPRKVDDEVGLFSKDAVKVANEGIATIKSVHQKDLLIETREKGKEDPKVFRQWAEDQAKERRLDGIYILITMQPKRFEVLVNKQTLKSGLFNMGDQEALTRILKENLAKKPDEALRLLVDNVHVAFGRKPSDRAAELKALLKERHDTLMKLVAQLTVQAQTGVVDVGRMAQTQRQLLKATVDLDESPETRVAALRKIRDMAKEIVQIVEQMPTATKADVLQATAFLLEARIEVLKAELKSSPGK